MNNDIWRTALLELIGVFENRIHHQNNVDDNYNEFCSVIQNEMDKYLLVSESSKKVRKKFKYHKPFWNEELTSLWKVMHDSEKAYKRSDSHNRKNPLYQKFIRDQKQFDKMLKKTERSYYRGQCLDIENVETKNPTEFWKKIKSLGPNKKKDIPVKVYDDNNSVCGDIDVVLNKWKSDFQNLYNKPEEDTTDTWYQEKIFARNI